MCVFFSPWCRWENRSLADDEQPEMETGLPHNQLSFSRHCFSSLTVRPNLFQSAVVLCIMPKASIIIINYRPILRRVDGLLNWMFMELPERSALYLLVCEFSEWLPLKRGTCVARHPYWEGYVVVLVLSNVRKIVSVSRSIKHYFHDCSFGLLSMYFSTYDYLLLHDRRAMTATPTRPEFGIQNQL